MRNALVVVRSDSQTTDSVFFESSGQRTESRHTKSGQRDIGQSFLHKSGQNRDRKYPDKQTENFENTHTKVYFDRT